MMDSFEFFADVPFRTGKAFSVPAYIQFDSADSLGKDGIRIDKRNFDGYEDFLKKLVSDYNYGDLTFKQHIYQILEETMDIGYVARNYEALKELKPLRSDITNKEMVGDYWVCNIVNMSAAQYEILSSAIRIDEIGDYVVSSYGLMVNENGLYYLPNYVNNADYSVEDWRIKE